MSERAQTAIGQPLSDEEDLIMRLLARGKSPKEIAAFLEVSHTHISQRTEYIRGKLGAETTVQAMHLWTRLRAALPAPTLDDRLRDRANGITEDCE